MTDTNTELIISPEESQRISILKVWLSIMIVFIHSNVNNVNFVGGKVYFDDPEWLTTIKYLVSEILSRSAVPAFFFLSAYFLYRKSFTWKQNVLKKVYSLLVPYFILNLAWIVIFFLAQTFPFTSSFFPNPQNIVANWGLTEWAAHIFGSPSNSYPMVYPLWFLRDLFILNLLSPVYEWFVRKTGTISLIFFILLWLLLKSTHIFFLDIQGVCFWGIGCWFAIKRINVSSLDKYKLPLIFIYPGLVVAVCLLHTSSGLLFDILYRICIPAGMVFWYVWSTNIKNERCKKLLLFISGYSFGIYLFHEMNLSILRKLLAKLLPQTPALALIMYFVIPFVIIVFCVVLCCVLERFTPRLYTIITGGRKQYAVLTSNKSKKA